MALPTRNQPRQRYELLERIGAGGMAEVFSAKARGPHGFEKKVALKRILPEYARSARFEQRLLSEARIAVTLNHANIVPVFDCGRFGESLYVVMELVEGLDLSAMLKELRERARPMPVGLGLFVATKLLLALDFAHTRGVVHRDVSPSNILLSRAGEVKLADFGIAQAVGLGEAQPSAKRIVGKWRYMSPEQTRGEELDARSDVFSAGAVLFELFTGHRLFDGDSAKTIVRNVRSMRIPRPSVLRRDLPEELDGLLGSALKRKADHRAASATELERGLAAVINTHSLHGTALDLAELVEELLPTDYTEVDPSDLQNSADLIDEILRSELSAKGAASEDWRTLETSGSGARRLSEDEADDPTSIDTEPPIAGEDRTSTITLVLPEASRVPEVSPSEEVRTPQVAVGRADAFVETESIAPRRGSRSSRRGWLLVTAGAGVALAAALLLLRSSGDMGVGTSPVVVDAGAPLTAAGEPLAVTVEPLDSPSDTEPRTSRATDAGAVALRTTDAKHRHRERRPANTGNEEDKPRYGTIKLYVEPWAEVYLDDRKVGVAPLRRLTLPVGVHRLKLINPVLKRTGWVEVTVPSQRTYRVVLPEAKGD